MCSKSRIVVAFFAVVFVMIVVLAVTAAEQAESVSMLLEKGIYTEETVGDLDAAIEIYEQIVTEAQASRSYVAQAHYRLGMCYMKKGKNEEAATTFQKLIDQFPEQQEVVAQARAELTALRAPGPGSTLRRVCTTSDPWNNAISPDGKYLFYPDWSTGDISVREIATGKTRHLTNKGSWEESGGFGMNCIMSPDSKRVAYNWCGWDTETVGDWFDLCLIGFDGSDPRVLFNGKEKDIHYLEPYGWSSDAKHILTYIYRNDRSGQMAWVSVADGSVTVLKSWAGRPEPSDVSLSPNGHYIAYSFPQQEGASEYDIFLLTSDGSKETTLLKHPADDRSVAWSADGKWILFHSDRSGSWDMWIIRVSDGKTQGLPRLVRADVEEMNPIGFTLQGSYYYAVAKGMSQVYVADFDPETGKIVDEPTAISRHQGSSPGWSHDGRYLAYWSRTRSKSSGTPSPSAGWDTLCIYSAETGEHRELTPRLGGIKPDVRAQLRWSPDGTSILINAWRDKIDGPLGLYSVDIDTGDVTPLAQSSTHILAGEWSRDGKAIFYRRRGSIFIRDLETGREKELLGKRPGMRMRLSPDGEQLALMRRGRIAIMPSGGGEPREILRERMYNMTWSPDGRYLIFIKARGIFYTPTGETSEKGLWRISVDGGEPERLWWPADKNKKVSAVDVHPNGRRIVFTIDEGGLESEVWVMENFLPTE